MDLDEINNEYKEKFKDYLIFKITEDVDNALFFYNLDEQSVENILEGFCNSRYFIDFCYDDFEIFEFNIRNNGTFAIKNPTVFDNLPSVINARERKK